MVMRNFLLTTMVLGLLIFTSCKGGKTEDVTEVTVDSVNVVVDTTLVDSTAAFEE